jgi:hypothetical protein
MGRESASTTVEIWDLLYRKGPMTLPQIVAEIRQRPGIPNAAMMAYKPTLPVPVQKLVPERPADDYIQAAVTHLVKHTLISLGSSSGSFTRRTPDGGTGRVGVRITPADLFSANKDRPPYVWEYVSRRRLVPYDPAKRQDGNARAAAGRQFTAGVGAVLRNKSRQLDKDVRALLELADAAIRVSAE